MPIRFLSDQSIDNQLTIQGAANGSPLLKLYSSTGDGAIAQFSDQSSLSQTGDLRYVHIDLQSYGSGNAFIFESNQSTLSVLADGKLLFKEGLFIKPSSGTGGGTQLITSTGAYKIPSISNAGTDTDQFLVRDSSGNVDFRTGAEVRSDIGAGTGTMSSWTITADNAVSHGVTNSAVVDIAGGTNISTSQSSGTVTITNGITNNNQLTNGAGYITSASLPTVNNGTLTMTTSTGLDGGATFTANQSGNSTFAVTLDLTEISLGAGLDSSATGLSLDLSEFTDMTQTMVGSDEFIVLDNGAERRKAASEIGLSIFSNDAGFITSGSLPTVNNSTITFSAGTGLTGGGTITLNQSNNETVTFNNSITNNNQLTNGAGYITSITIGSGTGLTGGGTGTSFNLNLDLNELTTTTGSGNADFFPIVNSGGSQFKIAPGDIDISTLNNDAGFITSASIPSVGNGTLTVSGSTGLSGSGTFTANQSGNTTITLTNSDRGSSQNIYKNFTADSGGTASANSNNDTIDIAGGTNISTARSGDTITINNGITNNNQLTNGAGYITSASLPSVGNGTITMVAGTGLTGGGTFTTNQSGNTSITFNASGSGTMSNWNLTADSGGTAQIDNGETVDIVGGTNITTARSGNNVTINNGITNNNQLTNGAGYTTNTGDITAVVAGAGLTGGSTSGSATLNLDVDGTNNYIEMNNDVTPASGDFVPFSDISTNVVRKTTFSDIPLSILNNDIGFGSGTVTSVATGNGISGGTITTSGTLTVGAGNGLSQSSTGLLMSGSYSGSFTVNGSTLSLTNSSGYAALEVGGTSGAFIDLKKPASDDYDIRLIHTTAGSNELTTASGALTINTGNSAAMHISTSDINLIGGKIKLESITSIDMQSSHLKIGDVDGSDEVEQISLITMANTNIVLQDQIIKLQSDDVQFNSTSTQDVIYGSNVKNVLPGDMTGSGFQGDVLKTITQSVSAGLLYYKTTTGWALADADFSSATYLLAIATGSNASSGMLLRGFFYKASHGFTIGRPLYVGTSAGNLQQSAPTGSSDYARVVGYPTSSDTIYFNPDNTWVRVS